MNVAPDNNLPEAHRWLKQAGEHFSSAEWAAQGKYWPSACFQFQQADELALKSLLIRNGLQIRVHVLLHLLESLCAHYPEIGFLEPAARSLDRFYVPSRYPDALPTGTSAAYFRSEDAASEILSFARQILAPP